MKVCTGFRKNCKPLKQMVKKSLQLKWSDIEKVAFKEIKTIIANSPSLRRLDFEKDLFYTPLIQITLSQ